MKLKKKFISDLDILKAGRWILRQHFLVAKAILRLFYGIKVNHYFKYERDHRKMGFIIEYN